MSNIIAKVIAGVVVSIIALLVITKISWITLLLLPVFIIFGIILGLVILFAKLGENNGTRKA